MVATPRKNHNLGSFCKDCTSVLENVFLVIAKSFLARIFVMGSAETSRGLWLGWQWADGTIGLGVQCKNVL